MLSYKVEKDNKNNIIECQYYRVGIDNKTYNNELK